MKVEEKLSVFSKVVMNEAEEKRKQIMTEMECEFNRACQKAENDAHDRCENWIRQEKYRAAQLINKGYLYAATDSRKRLADLKRNLTDKLFRNVKKKLEDYVSTEEYGNYLAREILNFAGKYPEDELEVLVMNRDLKYSDRIKLRVTGVNDDFIGGFKIIFKNRNAVQDNTFLSRLEEERSNFNLFRTTI